MLSKILILLVVLLLPWNVSEVLAQDEHGHNHDESSEQEAVEETHNEDDNSYAEEQSGGLTVELSSEAVKLAGITFSKVKTGPIGSKIELPGEIGFNEDRLLHISPRFAGIALKANFQVGDYVKAGEVVAIIESNESLNSYSITAPISGWVIERHITRGEFVSQENSIYIIADLSTVWVNLAVYQKDANRIKKGVSAVIKSIGTDNITTGIIDYITPIIDLKTRSATARVVLSNSSNEWRPGSFVQATITMDSGNESLLVEKNAVQYLDEKSVIFVVKAPNKFAPVEVIIGDNDDYHIQIIGGLSEGTKYVSTGAFELKAKIVTSNLDAHAGHGH